MMCSGRDVLDFPGQLTQYTGTTEHRHTAVAQECALYILLSRHLEPKSNEPTWHTARHTLGLSHVTGYLAGQAKAAERAAQANAHVMSAVCPVGGPASRCHGHFSRL